MYMPLGRFWTYGWKAPTLGQPEGIFTTRKRPTAGAPILATAGARGCAGEAHAGGVTLLLARNLCAMGIGE
jgi:hypothetical protein